LNRLVRSSGFLGRFTVESAAAVLDKADISGIAAKFSQGSHRQSRAVRLTDVIRASAR